MHTLVETHLQQKMYSYVATTYSVVTLCMCHLAIINKDKVLFIVSQVHVK